MRIVVSRILRCWYVVSMVGVCVCLVFVDEVVCLIYLISGVVLSLCILWVYFVYCNLVFRNLCIVFEL